MARPEIDDTPLLRKVAELIVDGTDDAKALTAVAAAFPRPSLVSARHRLARKWRLSGTQHLAEARGRARQPQLPIFRDLRDNIAEAIAEIASIGKFTEDLIVKQHRKIFEGFVQTDLNKTRQNRGHN
jgi:hypothetical protein